MTVAEDLKNRVSRVVAGFLLLLCMAGVLSAREQVLVAGSGGEWTSRLLEALNAVEAGDYARGAQVLQRELGGGARGSSFLVLLMSSSESIAFAAARAVGRLSLIKPQLLKVPALRCTTTASPPPSPSESFGPWATPRGAPCKPLPPQLRGKE